MSSHRRLASDDISPGTRLLAKLAAQRRGLGLAVRMDSVRSQGVRSVWSQRAAFRSHLAEAFAEARRVTYLKIWEHAAQAVGCSVEPLGNDFLLLRDGTTETIVRGNSVVLNDGPGMALTHDKLLVHKLLSDASLPVPEHVEIDRFDITAGRDFLLSSDIPCVVKPAAGTGGGAGVTGSVATLDDLQRVTLSAGRWGRRVLVERMQPGDEYRLLFLDGALLDVVRRRPPQVVGDGMSTIADLIRSENQRRAASAEQDELRALRMDLDVELTLARQGHALQSVPEPGVHVQVKSSVSENARADNTNVSDLADELVAQAAEAARVTRLRLAGVDVITPDPTVALERAGGAIIEVNSPPGLHYHYLVEPPESADPVAVPILRRMLSDAALREAGTDVRTSAANGPQ